MKNQLKEKVGVRGSLLKMHLTAKKVHWWVEPKGRVWRSISLRMMLCEHSPCLRPTRWLMHLAAIKQPIYFMWKVALFDNGEKEGWKKYAKRKNLQENLRFSSMCWPKNIVYFNFRTIKTDTQPFFCTKQCIVGMWTLPCIKWTCSLEAKCTAEQKGDA